MVSDRQHWIMKIKYLGTGKYKGEKELEEKEEEYEENKWEETE